MPIDPISWCRQGKIGEALKRVDVGFLNVDVTSFFGHHRTGRTIKRATLLAGCAFMAASFCLSTQALAQNSCARIQSELASAHSGGGQLGAAINQQSAELARARGAYDRFQCSFGGHPQCGSIVATIGQMESNLVQMQRQQARSGGGIDRNRIAELERVFATQCGPNQRQQPIQAAAPPRNQGNSLLAAIFGTRSQPSAIPRSYDPSRVVLPGQPANRGFYRPGEVFHEPEFRVRGNTFRTMCVRTSDGFYWPISFSTTRDRFDEDQGSCQAMCPGVGVELYAYRNPGQQIDAMVSTQTGLPYADQDYAFAYRTEFDPANRCSPSMAMLDELRPSAGLAYSQQPTGPRVPRPSPRPDMASDPETRALQASNSSFAALAALSSRETGGDELVRVVGPNYGYFNE